MNGIDSRSSIDSNEENLKSCPNIVSCVLYAIIRTRSTTARLMRFLLMFKSYLGGTNKGLSPTSTLVFYFRSHVYVHH